MYLQPVEDSVPITSLLPPYLIEAEQAEEKGRRFIPCTNEKCMVAMVQLIINVGLRSISELQLKHYKKFDANPGDSGCQARALELRRIFGIDLKNECKLLSKRLSELRNQVNRRNVDRTAQRLVPPELFFERNVKCIGVSKEMHYLFQCYVSTVLRTPYETLPNGVVMTMSEPSKLSLLSKNIVGLDSFSRRKIVEENQKMLSMLSIEAMGRAASQVVILPAPEKERMVAMLSKENVSLYTPDPKYEPKAFGCLFYQIETVVMKLREDQALVCVKSIVPKGGKSFTLFFQSQAPHQDFSLLSDERYAQLKQEDAIVVFEAVVHQEKEIAAASVMEYGFTPLMLVQGAIEAPYHRGSTLVDVTLADAREEILSFRQRPEAMQRVLTLDHVYLERFDEIIK